MVADQLQALRQSIQSCTRCPLHQTRVNAVPGEGPVGADIMILGEAPGQSEDQTGRPFVGQAGKVLDKLLLEAGLERSRIYISNIIKSRPPNNRDPDKSEVSACLKHLLTELDIVQPKVVLLMGAQALNLFTGKTGMKQHRGTFFEPLPTFRLNAKLTATWHPAYYLHSRQPMIAEQIRDDLRFVANAVGSTKLPKHVVRRLMPQGYTSPSYDADDLRKELGRFVDIDPVAVDAEWTAIQDADRNIGWPWVPNTELYSLSISGRHPKGILSVAIPWPPPDDDCLDVLNGFFFAHKAIFHNAMADLIWLHHVGLQPVLAGDTQVLAYLLDEGQGLKLSQLASTQLGIENWKRDLWDHQPNDLQEWHDLLTYNSQDVYATLLLHEALVRKVKQRSQTEQTNIRRLYARLMLPATHTFARVARAGVPFDEQRLQGALAHEERRMGSLVGELAEQVGVPVHQAKPLATSAKQTTAYLRDAFHLEVDSSNQNALAPYLATHPQIKLIQDIRNSQKLMSSYLVPYTTLLTRQRDGRIHSIYRLTSTLTGRSSAELEESGGSIQVFPHDPWARKIIRAPQGYKIVSADQGQAELRLGAVIAGERNMLQLLREGADLHKATAAFIKAYGESKLSVQQFWPERERYMLSVTKADRQRSKAINFGLLYGMRELKLVLYAMKQYGVSMSLAEATTAREGYFTLYPDLPRWHAHCEDEFRRNAVQVTPLGRYRRYFNSVNELINFKVQSVTSDLVLLSINAIQAEFDALGMESIVVAFIHDNVLVLSPDHEVAVAGRIVRKHMEHPNTAQFGWDDIGVPLVSDVLVGQSWGEGELLAA